MVVTVGAGWVGSVVGMKQAQTSVRSALSSIEDPVLRDVYV